MRLPPRGYDCVVFNMTTKEKEDVRTRMSDRGVEVIDILLLSKDDSDRPTYMFMVKVHYKDKNTVVSGLSLWDADITSIRRKWILVRNQENKLIQTIIDNLLRIATFNCEGINRSRDYMHDYLNESSCDILCLQETWHLDENINLFNLINTNYLSTDISGVESRTKI